MPDSIRRAQLPASRAGIGDPDLENSASIRAFEKAGLCRTSEFLDPDDGRAHTLMRLRRDPHQSSYG